ncbi:DUF4260 family protein [Streptomyces sp. HNM0663]|uniref:DUF4260 family protein n=1 Tax=Streptomyces chengmaiensis TaxID=3040919 RepID=A0ABT6HR23_9ACTN|nr:DUF4260 family protein [Streptomyces chengmaiensis]MDH2390781.1 DUF4260 family protein [Streptomyces chengmaiensis]
MTTLPTVPGPALAELRRYATLHARAQEIPEERCRALLERMTAAHGDGPGSWAAVWSGAGDVLADRGRPLEASRCYGLARFPYVSDGDMPRRRAARRCVEAFDDWRRARPGLGVERLDIALPEGRFACWTAGLATHARPARRPLVVVMGGIVSVKEQWAPILARAKALGVALAVTEMPGVGENTLPYRADGCRMLGALLDRLDSRADVTRTGVIALSFGGHLALRAALDDPRIRGVATVGAPLHRFFRDRDWQRRVPDTTVRTLAHLIGCRPDRVFDTMRGWALTGHELQRLTIPVTYAAALRDDIVPPDEPDALLRAPRAPREILRLDDEHGAPSELPRLRLTLLRAALRAAAAPPARRAALTAALAARRRDAAWTYRAPLGRAVSGLIGATALAAGVHVAGARSRTLWTCAVLPDVALLYGIAAAPTFERLPRYAVRPYNALHSPAVPAALFAAAAVTRSRATATAALGWLAHIAVDRAFGYGPRRPDGLRRGVDA